MAEQRKYSLITVGQDDQDEVIYAGVRPEPQPEPQLVAVAGAAAVEEAEVADPAPVSPTEADFQPAFDAQGETESEPAAAPAAPEPVLTEAQQALKDLEAEPMSGKQRGVLIAAALFVAAFVAYMMLVKPLVG